MQLNDRIIGLRRIKANELIDNPNNWRRHPDVQRSALSQLLEQIGIADACIARQTPDGLELIDGHLRKELAGGELLPVLVLDVSEAEAQTLLLSLDPLAAMALAHEDALATLMAMAVAPEEILEELHRQHLQAMARASHPDPDEIPSTRAGSRVKAEPCRPSSRPEMGEIRDVAFDDSLDVAIEEASARGVGTFRDLER